MSQAESTADKGRMPDELFEEYWSARAKHIPDGQREVVEHAFYSGWTLYAVEMQKLMKEPCPVHQASNAENVDANPERPTYITERQALAVTIELFKCVQEENKRLAGEVEYQQDEKLKVVAENKRLTEELDRTEKVYRMNRDYVEDAKLEIKRLNEVNAKLREALEKIRWSWENDAGRACDEIARLALKDTNGKD